jgi:hypothetical protein
VVRRAADILGPNFPPINISSEFLRQLENNVSMKSHQLSQLSSGVLRSQNSFDQHLFCLEDTECESLLRCDRLASFFLSGNQCCFVAAGVTQGTKITSQSMIDFSIGALHDG